MTSDAEKPDFPKAYLGDGVYADFDGYQIWLHTNEISPGNFLHSIAIEPQVFDALLNYKEKLRNIK